MRLWRVMADNHQWVAHMSDVLPILFFIAICLVVGLEIALEAVGVAVSLAGRLLKRPRPSASR
jgi:hypothetical protein